MDPSIASEILRAALSGLILAIVFGAIATWVWMLPRLFRDEPLLPEGPIVERRRTPWGIGTILLVLAAYVLVSRYAFETYGRAAHPGRAKAHHRVEKKGGQAPDLAKPGPADQEPPGRAPAQPPPAKPDAGQPANPVANEADELPYGLTPFEAMSIQGAINALFILLVPLLARLTSGARLRDFGLSLRGWRRQVAVGVVAVLFLMPIVYSVQFACMRLLDMTVPEIEKNKHPLEKMLRDNLTPSVASVAFLTAVVLAPAFEELLFRGFIQSWLVKTLNRLAARPRPSPAEKAIEDPAIAQATQADPLADPDLDRSSAGTDAAIEFWQAAEEPASKPDPDDLIIEDPEAGEAPSRPGSSLWTGIAIVLTSLIFAALHAPQWPAPIPLFLLAMGLGFVAQRTGSLIAPICMHAIFNGFSTMMLFYVALEGPDRGKPPARPLLERVVPAEKAREIAPDVRPGPRPGKT